jgi:outer membrane protein assembly factor BamB
MINEPFGSLGVVPIFVNAGAALVPTIVASVTSVAAILFKPRALLDLFRRKPWVPVAVVTVGVGLWFGIAHLAGGAPANGASARKGADASATTFTKTDWQDLALKLIRKEQEATKVTGIRSDWSYMPEAGAMVWSTPAHDPKSNRVFCTATVQDVGSFFGLLYCVDAKEGKRVWSVDKAGPADLKPFFSSPAVTPDGKYVIIGQGLHADADCSLLCFDAETGNLAWQVKTPLHIESSPAIRGDVVVVGAGAIEDANHKPTTDPGFVFAVRIKTGEQLWKHAVSDPESSPAFAEDGTVYIGSGFNGKAVVALRSETDADLKAKNLPRELWKIKAPFPITGPVTLDGDLVIVGGGNSDFVYADPNPAGVVMALDRKTGAVRWQTPMEDSVLNRMVVRDGKVFCPVRSGNVVALSLADGKPAWRQPVNGKSPVLGGVAVSDDGRAVFAASQDGTLAVMDAATGKLIDKNKLNAEGKPVKTGSFSSPTLAQNKLFIGSETGGLRCFVAIEDKK